MSEPNYPEIPPEAYGGRRPADDELRFWRLIEERPPGASGWEHDSLKLACGHTLRMLDPTPRAQEYAFCGICYLDDIIRTGTQ